jgi:hypothetical protein
MKGAGRKDRKRNQPGKPTRKKSESGSALRPAVIQGHSIFPEKLLPYAGLGQSRTGNLYEDPPIPAARFGLGVTTRRPRPPITFGSAIGSTMDLLLDCGPVELR